MGANGTELGFGKYFVCSEKGGKPSKMTLGRFGPQLCLDMFRRFAKILLL